MTALVLNAADAFARFPKVRGHINRAVVGPDWAILEQGPGAFGVVISDDYVACCPTRAHAERVVATYGKVQS